MVKALWCFRWRVAQFIISTTAAKLGGSSKASQPADAISVGLGFTRKQERAGTEGETAFGRSLCWGCGHLVVIVARGGHVQLTAGVASPTKS